MRTPLGFRRKRYPRACNRDDSGRRQRLLARASEAARDCAFPGALKVALSRAMLVVMIGAIIVIPVNPDGRGFSIDAGRAVLIREGGSSAEGQSAQRDAVPEKIIAGPQTIKERTAILVFLGWMWVSIGVLIYLLRLKIKEVDRLHRARYFSPRRE